MRTAFLNHILVFTLNIERLKWRSLLFLLVNQKFITSISIAPSVSVTFNSRALTSQSHNSKTKRHHALDMLKAFITPLPSILWEAGGAEGTNFLGKHSPTHQRSHRLGKVRRKIKPRFRAKCV